MGLSLVTLAEYKAYVGITSTTQDVSINSLIPAVSNLVKLICRRTFVDYVDTMKVEVFKGGPVLNVAETPLIAVSTLEYSLDYGTTYTELVEFTDFAIDQETSQIVPIKAMNYYPDYYAGTGTTLRYNPSPEFPKRINGYRVTYTAGYETIPYDLKMAVMDLISYQLKGDAAVKSQKPVGSNTMQIEYILNTHLPAHIKRVLDQYTESYN
jgi:hypothetical protein